MKAKKLLSILSANVLTLPFFAFSCQTIRDKKSKDVYIKNFNQPNLMQQEKWFYNKKVENDFESLIHTPLVKYEFQDKIVYDNINKIFTKPSRKKLTFNLAKKIIITMTTNEVKVYDNDNEDLEFPQENFKNGIVSYTSNNVQNINHPQFLKDLKKAKKIEFELKENINFIDNNGKKTKYKLSLNNYLNTFKKQNQDDLISLFNEYYLDYETFIQQNVNNCLSFEIANGTLADIHDLSQFFINEIINNLLFNPSIKNTYGNYFIGEYYLAHNSINKQEFKKNPYFKVNTLNKNKKRLKKIILKYNPLILDNETYSLQIFNSYKQNLISEADIKLFNYKQQDEITLNKKIYGYNYSLKTPLNKIPINIFYNYHFKPNQELGFNEVFSKIFYGVSAKDIQSGKALINNHFFDKTTLKFKELLNLAINKYSFIKYFGYNHYNNSYIPHNFIFNSKKLENSNYRKIIDGIKYINAEFNLENKMIFDIEYIQHYYDKRAIVDQNFQIQGQNFKKLQEQMKQLIDNFYSKNNIDSSQNIEFIIPVFDDETQINKKNYSLIVEIYKLLDSRIKPTLEFVKNANTNKQYYLTFEDIDIKNNNVSSFLKTMLLKENNSWLIAFSKFDKNLFFKTNYKEFIEFYEQCLNSKFGLELIKFSQLKSSEKMQIFKENKIQEFKTIIDKYIINLSTWEQIKLLTQIHNIIKVPMSSQNHISYNDYEPILIQPYLEKPTNDLGYILFQDIIVK